MPVDTTSADRPAADRPAAVPERSARWVGRLAGAVALLGWGAALLGAAYAVNGATQAPATVKVPVLLAAGPSAGWGNVPLTVPGVEVPDGWVSGAQPTGFATGATDGRVTIAARGSTRVEQVLARGQELVGGLACLAGALLLEPVLRAIAAGRPFAPGGARRVGWLAAVVAVAGVVGPLLPQLAGLLVLDRTGLAGGPAFAGGVESSTGPLLVAALVLVVAVVLAAGERLTGEVGTPG
ncbi:hypothetical protein [Cellulomonas sp. URHB0016]